MYELKTNINLTITIQTEGVSLPIVHVSVPIEGTLTGGVMYRMFLTKEEIASFDNNTLFALFVINNGVRVC